MNRGEWCAYAESMPLTPDQRGRIMHECDRLRLVDRAERLSVLAELLGLDGLGSTADLTMGQAGYLVRLLQDTLDRAELSDITAAADGEDQADEHDGYGTGARISIAEALRRIAVMVYLAFNETKDAEGRP